VFNNLGDKATLVEIISFEGLTVYSQTIEPDTNGNASITNLNNIKPGIYFVKVWGNEGVTVNKLVKQ
ncbi:MAG: T9SS type A sorting domain-containing protein, partial [Bacteroidia bacterium]